MADAEKSLLFVIKANITDFNKALGDSERNFKRSMGNIQKAADEMSKVMGGIGIAIAGSLAAAFNKFASYSDDIANASVRMGMGTTAVQELGFAAKVSGSSMEGLETAVKFMQKGIDGLGNVGKDTSEDMAALQKELDGIAASKVDDKIAAIQKQIGLVHGKDAAAEVAKFNEQIAQIRKDDTTADRIKEIKDQMAALQKEASDVPKAFERLNLTLADLQGLSPDQQFRKIAAALNNITVPATKAALAIQIFGRSGTEMLPMINDLETLTQKASDFGIILDEAMIKKGVEANTKLEIIKAQLGTLFVKLGEASGFDKFFTNISKIITDVMSWIDKNKELVEWIGKLAVALLVAAAALKAFSIGMAIAQGLSGVGLAKMAIGGVVAAGSVAAINKLSEVSETQKGPEMYNGEDVSVLTPYQKKLMGVPGYAQGGIVTNPTLAMVGESGAEAIVPLSDSRFGTTLNISVGNYMGDEMSLRQFTRKISEVLNQEDRRSSNAATRTTFYSQGGHL